MLIIVIIITSNEIESNKEFYYLDKSPSEFLVDEECYNFVYETEDFLLDDSNNEITYQEVILECFDLLNDGLSQGQINIVKRARQMTEIEWIPLRTIRSWREHPNFEAGMTYKGIPYGRPINHVPVDISLEEFINAVNDLDSRMYTSNSTRDSVAPFYSTDCSAFVSYAWGVPRHWTWEFPQIADNIGNNLHDIEVGDILNNPHIHVVLVTDIVKESDEIISIEISEAFGKISRRRWFGEGHERTLNQINSNYLNSGYNILRFRERDYVMYEHSCLIPIVFCVNCE